MSETVIAPTLELPTAAPAPLPDGWRLARLGDAVARTLLALLFFFDDDAPDFPIRLHHHLIDRAVSVGAGGLKNHGDVAVNPIHRA